MGQHESESGIASREAAVRKRLPTIGRFAGRAARNRSRAKDFDADKPGTDTGYVNRALQDRPNWDAFVERPLARRIASFDRRAIRHREESRQPCLVARSADPAPRRIHFFLETALNLA